MKDYLYEKEKADELEESKIEWFESKLNDILIEYCDLCEENKNRKGRLQDREEGKAFIIRALKNI